MLDYMATCRCADKKLCDNIPNKPNATCCNALTKNGGKEVTNTIAKSKGTLDNLLKAAGTSSTHFASAMSGQTDVVESAMRSILPKSNISTIMVEPIGLGKMLCPSAR